MHCPRVAQTSQSAVSRVFQPAGGPVSRNASLAARAPNAAAPADFGNRRYSRLGNLRYGGSARLCQVTEGVVKWLEKTIR